MKSIPTEKEIAALTKILADASNILVVMHKRPDSDAIASGVATCLFLSQLGKQCTLISETLMSKEFDWMQKDIKARTSTIPNAVKSIKPDTVLFLDSPVYSQFFIENPDENFMKLHKIGINTVLIDHHKNHTDKFDLVINHGLASAVEEIYGIFVVGLGLKLNKEIADIMMYGIVGETARFLHANPNLENTFNVTLKLVEKGASIEETSRKLFIFSRFDLDVISELLKNLTIQPEFHYSYVSDEFFKQNDVTNKHLDQFKASIYKFCLEFLKSIQNNNWGFIVYQNTSTEAGYSVSFRAVDDIIDVSEIAVKLGGGGHKGSAAAEIKAKTVTEAVEKVKAVALG